MFKLRVPKPKAPEIKDLNPDQKELKNLFKSSQENQNPLKTQEENKQRQRWHRLKNRLGF